MIHVQGKNKPRKSFAEIQSSELSSIFGFVSEIVNEDNISLLQIGAGIGPKGGDYAGKMLMQNPEWSGLLIEPSIQNYNLCREAYKGRENVCILNAACNGSDTPYLAKINLRKNPNLNSFFEHHRIEERDAESAKIIGTQKVISLPISCLIQISNPNWVSVDTEGMDEEIVKSILSMNQCPKYVSFEHHFISKSNMESIHNSMMVKGYSLSFKSHSDVIYIFQKNV